MNAVEYACQEPPLRRYSKADPVAFGLVTVTEMVSTEPAAKFVALGLIVGVRNCTVAKPITEAAMSLSAYAGDEVRAHASTVRPLA